MIKVNWSHVPLVSTIVIFNVILAAFIYSKFGAIGTDGAIYALVGKNIAEGHGLSLYGLPHTIFSPLLSYSIAVFYKLNGNLEIAAAAATIFWWLASIPLFYWLARRLLGHGKAMIAVLLFGLNGQLILNYATEPKPQPAVGFFGILIALAMIEISNHDSSQKILIWSVVAGIATGFAYLARPEYILFLLLILIYVFWNLRHRIYRGIGLKSAGLVLVGFLIISAPYFIFLKNSLGRWTISGRTGGVTLNILRGTDSGLSGDNFVKELDLSREKFEGGFTGELLKSAPSNIKKFLKNLRDEERFMTQSLGFIGLIFFAFGLREIIRSWRFDVFKILIISLTPLLVVSLVVTNVAGYLLPYFFVFILFISFGLTSFIEELAGWFKWSDQSRRRVLFTMVTITILYLFFPVVQTYLFWPKDIQPREWKEMGMWMRDNIPNIEQGIVLARKPDVSFYSGARFESIPDVSPIELARYMKEKGIQYVVIDNRFSLEDRRQFLPLLDDSLKISSLKPIHSAVFYQKKIVLYKVL